MTLFLTLAAATLVSEDLACVAAGLLIQQGRLEAPLGVAACAAGIFLGDVGLYAVGRRLGVRVLEWPTVKGHLGPARRAQFTAWFARHAATALLASRFLPGTRLPFYVACGALRASFSRFCLWSLVAVLLWAPALVLASAQGTALAVNPVVPAIILLIGVRVMPFALTRRGRQRAVAVISRVWRWEFWPMWLFYAPVAVWIAWLAIRHRGFGAIAAANPGIPDGGIVGESKHEILSHLPPEFTLEAARVPPGTSDARMWRVLDRMTHNGWTFPLVFKPDVGQRGAGVKIVRSLEEAAAYLSRERHAVVVQRYHPGPYEAGVFYYRMPGLPHGRILSITDKHFPVVVGDGRSTLEELVWSDGRLRMQARTFLTRHAALRDRVLAAGERFTLAHAGNHAQGTLFRDGRHLITPALEECIDRIAWSFHGFFVGRFDIRYADVERFRAGEDLAIVELNGATAESTNIYDPAGSLISAYRQLFRQWSLVFAIGAANRDRGADTASVRRLFEIVRAHLSSTAVFETSD